MNNEKSSQTNEKEYPVRKPNRLPKQSYSQNGRYFITICTYKRICLLCDPNEDKHNPERFYLSEYGQIVNGIISEIPNHFGVSITNYVIMPNHIHIIVDIGYKRAILESPLQGNRSLISRIVGYLKMNSSKAIHESYPDRVWQRSFHDHIIRNGTEYRRIARYIELNPLCWEDDCFYI